MTNLRDAQKAQLDLVYDAYWESHKALAETSFSGKFEQLQAVKKLSELGLALWATKEAYNAMSRAAYND